MSDDPILIRKSMIEAYKFCPYRFKLTYVDGIRDEANFAMLVGTRFHDFAERFFDYCETVPSERWMEFVGNDYSVYEKDMQRYFIKREIVRYNTLGEQFRPLLLEIKLDDMELGITGTIDRIDWYNKKHNEVSIVEYKTGRKFDDTSIRMQMSLYKLLIEANTDYIVGNFQVVNPRLREVKDYKVPNSNRILKSILELKRNMKNNVYPYKCSEAKYFMCGKCDSIWEQ